MSILLTVLYTLSSSTFLKLCAARLFKFQWQTENFQLELVLVDPGFNSISSDINNSNKVKVRTVTYVFGRRVT